MVWYIEVIAILMALIGLGYLIFQIYLIFVTLD